MLEDDENVYMLIFSPVEHGKQMLTAEYKLTRSIYKERMGYCTEK